MTLPVLPASQGDQEAGIEVRRPHVGLKSVAFDLSTWHNGGSCVRSFVQGVGGIGVKVCCAPCGVLCDVEATGKRISVSTSFWPLQLSEVVDHAAS